MLAVEIALHMQMYKMIPLKNFSRYQLESSAEKVGHSDRRLGPENLMKIAFKKDIKIVI